MKLQKRIDPTHSIDQYVLYIPHAEADVAFKLMTPIEQSMVANLQTSDQISSILKVLVLWATKVEESKGVLNHPPDDEEPIGYEG